MKTATYQPIRKVQNDIPFPNAETRQQFLHKLLDVALMGAIGMGLAASLLFLLALA